MNIIAETIKGINVVIGAETTGLSKALSDVNKRSRDIQGELKQVEKLLKLDPTNTDLLAQKQKLLSDAVANTSSKLNSLKSAQEQVNEQFAKGEISEGQYRAFQREVAKTEQELNGFKGKLSEVSGEVKKHGAVIDKLGKDYKESFDQAKESLGNTFEQAKKLGAGLTAAGAGIAAGLGVAVKGAADFEQGMANAFSVMAPDEVAEFNDELKDLAMTMGADTKYSATEAARGIEELIKAGVSVKDVMDGGLSGALSLATAGELELADAAEVASTVLNAFRSDALSVQEAADILAGAANASATSVEELKFGLAQSAAVASSVGLSFQDTATALAAFAQNGLKGSDAGTSLKTMLMRLQPSTDAAYNEFKRLGLLTVDTQKVMEYFAKVGVKPVSDSVDDITSALAGYIAQMDGAKTVSSKYFKQAQEMIDANGWVYSSFYDANGQLKDMASIADLLQGHLSGLNDMQRQAALGTIFGADAIRAGNILYKEGAKGLESMATAMGKISAADVAAQKMNTFKGTIEQLKGSLETAQISIGTALLPAIRKVTETIQKLVDGFNKLSPQTQSLIATSTAVAAAIGLILGPLLMLIGFLPQIAAGLTLLTGPVGLVVAAIAATVAIVTVLYNKWDEIMKLSTPLKVLILALLAPFTAMTAAVKAVVYAFQNWDQIKETLNNLLNNVKEVFNNIGNFFTETIPKTINGVIDWFKKLPTNIKTLINELPGIIGTALGLALGKLVKWGVDGYNYMVTQVPKIIQAIGTFFSELPGKLLTHLNNAITNIKNWGTSIISWAGTEIPKVVSNIVSFFAELPKKMLDVGKQLITGLWDGIKGSATWLKDKINDFADGIIQGFKSAFDIHSPSRVMKNEVGKMIGLGMAEGIQSTVGNVKSAMNTLNGQVAVNPVSVGAGAVGSAGGNSITNSFTGMFSGANFYVRSDNDINLLAQQLGGVITQNTRALGGA